MAHSGRGNGPPNVPGVQGPNGQPFAMAPPYDMAPPASKYQAQRMMSQSVPLDFVQSNACNGPNCGLGGHMPSTVMPPGMITPRGVPFAPGMTPGPGINPASFTPNGAGASGLINANVAPGAMPAGGLVQAQLAAAGPGAALNPGPRLFQSQRTQVRFTRPTGMKITWFTGGPDGKPMYSTTPIETPGRYNFAQAAIYRLKLSNIEGRPGLEVYPTMEVVPSNPKTEAFLSHSPVPVEFTAEDFKQIAEGNYVVKVIYLPDPQFQDVAGSGTDEILSTRLEPGADPIQEALRRGSILLVIRMGSVDLEAPNTPPLNAPGPNLPPMMPPGGPNLKGGFQVPYFGKPGMPGPGPGMPMIPGPGGAAPGGPVLGPGPFTTPQNPATIPNVPAGPQTGSPLLPKQFDTAPAKFQEVPTAAPVLPKTPAESNVPVSPMGKGPMDTPNNPALPPPLGGTGAPTTTPLPTVPTPPMSSLPPPLRTTAQLATETR